MLRSICNALWTPIGITSLCCSGCLPRFELPEESPVSAASCGSSNQPCCDTAATACEPAFRCEQLTNTCQPAASRQCTTDDQCSAEQTCCVSGLLGSCAHLQAGAECPRADLEIVTTSETLELERYERVFAPQALEADACALEKMCIGGPGLRQLLRFSTTVFNSGDADLLLGDPDVAPFALAACDGRPYFPNFLSYTLVGLDGTPVAKGFMQAQSGALPAPFSSGFDSDFYGLAAGFSQSYPDRRAALVPAAPASDLYSCQWLDITGVASGSYILRLRVNGGGVLLEKDTDNNQVDIPIEIPRLDDATQACGSAGAGSLFGLGLERECGWRQSAATATCVPGQSVTLSCPDCTGDPMLRVCEGTSSCSAPAALTAGDDTFITCDVAAAELLPDNECPDGCCEYQSPCATVRFNCPASGTYTAYTAGYDTLPTPCNAVVQPSASSGGDAGP